MDKNPISELMQATMDNVKSMLKVDTVVGDPIVTPDGITLVPISKISLGFGGGGVEAAGKKPGAERPYGGGNATGVKIDPIGFLVIKEGTVRMINVTPPASNTVDRIIDMVPQVMDRVDAFITKQQNKESK
ncbi:MAG: GerW family sporulation protein [Candidatus Limivicinus sp.]|jgi:sporulation protein YtfJ